MFTLLPSNPSARTSLALLLMAANFPCMPSRSNVSCCQAEVRNIFLSSFAHQSLINRSSITHQSLINHSSIAHQRLIFFQILYALPKSPRVILRALCGYASYCTSEHVFCVVYLTASTFRHDITAPPASSLDSTPADGGKARNKSAARRRQRVRHLAREDIGRTLSNAFSVMSTCCEKSWLPSNRSSRTRRIDGTQYLRSTLPSRNLCFGRNNFSTRHELLVRRGFKRLNSSGQRSLFVTWHRGSSVISLTFARPGSCRICCGNERPWTSRPLKHSLAACGRSGTKLVRTRFGTTRSGTRSGLRSSLFARINRQRLFARR
jgi:hypothetical protein